MSQNPGFSGVFHLCMPETVPRPRPRVWSGVGIRIHFLARLHKPRLNPQRRSVSPLYGSYPATEPSCRNGTGRFGSCEELPPLSGQHPAGPVQTGQRRSACIGPIHAVNPEYLGQEAAVAPLKPPRGPGLKPASLTDYVHSMKLSIALGQVE